ncbi:MAG: hypothetical protein ACRDD7_10845 [Peptostreptococcaceae bacterium]
MENNKKNKIRDINEYKKNKKNKHKKGKKKKPIKKSKVLLTYIVIASVMILNLCGYAKISELKYDIHYLKKDLRSKEVVIEQLNAEVYSNTSIEEIEKQAKEKLNMDYPKDSQIEYITLED